MECSQGVTKRHATDGILVRPAGVGSSAGRLVPDVPCGRASAVWSDEWSKALFLEMVTWEREDPLDECGRASLM